MEQPGWTEPYWFTCWGPWVSYSGIWWTTVSWLDCLAEQSHFPTGSGLESCSWGGVGDTEGCRLSSNGSDAGCARVCGVRGKYGGGSSGSSTESPWNIVFPSPFFWVVTPQIPYPVPVHSCKILPMGAGSVLLEARSLCMETDVDILESHWQPHVLLGQWAGWECPLAAIQHQRMASWAQISYKASWGVILTHNFLQSPS